MRKRRILEEVETTSHTASRPSFTLNAHIMDGCPCISELAKCIAKQIGTDWFILGTMLEVPTNNLLELFIIPGMKYYDKALVMFDLWLNQCHLSATRRNLIDNLEKLNPKVAFDYKKHLGKHY